MRRRLVPALVGTQVLLVACGGAESRETPGRTEAPEAPEAVQLEHVHGLGVDPADGVLYPGTHHGLFRAEGSSIDGPLAGLRQDFMGFTVAGPNHFLASGHPPPVSRRSRSGCWSPPTPAGPGRCDRWRVRRTSMPSPIGTGRRTT